MASVKTKQAPKAPRTLPARPEKGRSAGRPKPQAAYLREQGGTPYLFTWRPALREWSDDVRLAWTTAASRAIDSIQNSGWISGAVDQSISYTVGEGLRLASKPDAAVLKWTADEAAEWAQNVERRWECWSDRALECDIEGKSTIGKLTAQAMRSHYCYGEVLAALPYLKRPFINDYGTKVQMLSPLRLRRDRLGPKMIDGIWRDMFNFPLAYRILSPPEWVVYGTLPIFEDVPARDIFGRSLVVHVFDGYPGQMRGIAPITPVLRVMRQFDQLSDATLTASLIQTIFAATVKSPAPTDQVLQAFQDMVEQRVAAANQAPPLTSPLENFLAALRGWYQGADIDLGHNGKIAHLAPGDELNFHASQHPNDTFEAFAKFLLREIAKCMGLTYEDFTGDYSGATYSSVRMATAAMWMNVIYKRAHILSPFLQPIFEAWLEEDIENGWTPFPDGINGFVQYRAAASRAHWRGPARPQADDLKFAKAVETLMAMGVISMEYVSNELGEDWEDVLTQRAREAAKRKQLGLPEPTFGKQGGNGGPPDGASAGEQP
jgi:lambda family phage portal protein